MVVIHHSVQYLGLDCSCGVVSGCVLPPVPSSSIAGFHISIWYLHFPSLSCDLCPMSALQFHYFCLLFSLLFCAPSFFSANSFRSLQYKLCYSPGMAFHTQLQSSSRAFGVGVFTFVSRSHRVLQDVKITPHLVFYSVSEPLLTGLWCRGDIRSLVWSPLKIHFGWAVCCSEMHVVDSRCGPAGGVDIHWLIVELLYPIVLLTKFVSSVLQAFDRSRERWWNVKWIYLSMWGAFLYTFVVAFLPSCATRTSRKGSLFSDSSSRMNWMDGCWLLRCCWNLSRASLLWGYSTKVSSTWWIHTGLGGQWKDL